MSNNSDLKLSYIPKCYKDDEGEVRFEPPVYIQRYNHVAAVINSNPIIQSHCKKLIDFGCAEMKFFYTVKHILPTIEHLLEVDFDEGLLIGSQFRVEPLVTDYMNRRLVPLKVEVYCGSVADPSPVLLGADVVVAIELIEHLYEDTLAALPQNIFGYIQPKVAIFTTPNSEINSIFPRLGAGFRHDDHKFEWTRKEFEDWAAGICEKYPEYSTKFYGVGPGPERTDHMGCVSQMVVFLRNDLKKLIENPEEGGEKILQNLPHVPPHVSCNIDDKDSYKLISKVEYPFDERTNEQKVIDEAKYHILNIERTEIQENGIGSEALKIDLAIIFNLMKHLIDTIENLQNLLEENGFTVIDGKIIVEPVDSNWSNSTEDNGFDEGEENNENNQNSVNVHQGADDTIDENWD